MRGNRRMTQEEKITPWVLWDIHCHLFAGIGRRTSELGSDPGHGSGGGREWCDMGRRYASSTGVGMPTTHERPSSGSLKRPDGKLEDWQIPLQLLPGADVRIDEALIDDLRDGMVQNDRRRSLFASRIAARCVFSPLMGYSRRCEAWVSQGS
jgi:hypothetical protein